MLLVQICVVLLWNEHPKFYFSRNLGKSYSSTHPHSPQCLQILFLSFFDTYSLKFLVCKVLIVTNFQVLLSKSSLVHFKNGPEYLTRVTVKLFIPLRRFLLQCLVSSWVFLFFRSILFLFFLPSLFDRARFQYSSVLVIFFFF